LTQNPVHFAVSVWKLREIVKNLEQVKIGLGHRPIEATTSAISETGIGLTMFLEKYKKYLWIQKCPTDWTPIFSSSTLKTPP